MKAKGIRLYAALGALGIGLVTTPIVAAKYLVPPLANYLSSPRSERVIEIKNGKGPLEDLCTRGNAREQVNCLMDEAKKLGNGKREAYYAEAERRARTNLDLLNYIKMNSPE
jgi:hypothetical protein